jgi:hypothetical protein
MVDHWTKPMEFSKIRQKLSLLHYFSAVSKAGLKKLLFEIPYTFIPSQIIVPSLRSYCTGSLERVLP